ncbi:peptidase family M13 [Rhizodiscina lignyota]|uniref:Peptidase family M13 n=1 Tax=Rhizodiscina lignyota TaxID=1504668 RepID=A0A9P4MA53_9PEZI|nr:peptidase family M13 [Rhizodiscina lignyota]
MAEKKASPHFVEERPYRPQTRSRTRAHLLTMGLLSTALIFYYLLPAGLGIFTTKSDTCLSAECIHASSEILYNLSPNYKELDPCTDFEELVCGGWRDRHDLREDQGDAFTGTIMSENSQLLLRHILEASYPKDSKHSHFSPMRLQTRSRSADEQNFDLMKSAYDACLDETTIKKRGVAPLLDVLRQVEEAFPEEPVEGDLRETILLLAKYGISALIAPGTGADDKSPDTVVVSLSPPWTIGLPSKERYEDEKLVKKYEGVLAQICSAFHPDRDCGITSNIVEFEKKLAAASPDTQEREDVTKTYNPYSLKEASTLAPQIDLAGIITTLAPARVEVDQLIITSPKYMKELSSILGGTPRDVLRGYFFWKAIQSLSLYIEADALKPLTRFKNELAGKDPDSAPERWRTCVNHVDDGVGWILSRFFVEKAFSAKAKDFGDRIVSDIKGQFAKKLKATKWMEEDVIAKAIDKVHNIVQKIGYPTKSPDIMDPGSVSEYYKSVKVDSSKYFANALSMRQVEVIREWSALGKPVDRNEWGMTVPTVNAYYNPPGNEIVFPAGIMQFPVFDVNTPAYVSYGAFGSVAGHELSHAFDSTGRHYDQNGNYTDWWTNSTVKAFQKRADCFVEQYGNYTVPGPDDKPLHVNGRLTLGENIADAGGLSASFQVWQMREKQKPSQDLPGLDFFTKEQLFFVSYSNWWCGKSRKETAIDRIYTDPHAPKWARILGTMANSREFKESFKCKQKKPVCELW